MEPLDVIKPEAFLDFSKFKKSNYYLSLEQLSYFGFEIHFLMT